MNKKLLSLFTFLLVVTSVSQSTFAQTSPQPQGRMMSPELQYCTLPAVKFMQGSNVAGTQYQMFLGYFVEQYPDGLEFMKRVYMRPDGKFGKITKEYTKFVQRKAGLVPDGIAGPKTRKVLTDFCVSSGLYHRMPSTNSGTIGSDNPYVKKVSLGDEVTVKPNSSLIINDTAVVVSVSQIYGNKCSAGAAAGLDVACTMEYAPAVKFSGMFGGDVSVGFSPQTLNVGEVSSFQLTEKTSATLKLVSVSGDGTSMKLKLEKK